MDGRIFFAGNQQLSAIRTQDLPTLTTAICGFERGIVSVTRCWKHEVGYVRFFAPGFEFNVLANDWQKLALSLYDGSLTPLVVAPGPLRGTSSIGGVPASSARDLADISTWDAAYYQKVYAVLATIFTSSYPTSRL